MGSGRAKVWTYLIVAVVLLMGVVAANFAMTSPDVARQGVDVVVGMPPWGFPAVATALGLLL